MVTQFYEDLCKAFELAWADDDIMEQETLFDLQYTIGVLLWRWASVAGKTDELKEKYPWVFR